MFPGRTLAYVEAHARRCTHAESPLPSESASSGALNLVIVLLGLLGQNCEQAQAETENAGFECRQNSISD